MPTHILKKILLKIRKAKVIRTQFKNDVAVTDSIVNYLVTESVHTEAKQAQVAQNVLLDTTTLALSTDLSESQYINIVLDLMISATQKLQGIMIYKIIGKVKNETLSHS